MAVGFSQFRTHGCGVERPTWLKLGDGPTNTEAYITSLLGARFVDCLQQLVLPCLDEIAGMVADPAPGDERLFAG